MFAELCLVNCLVMLLEKISELATHIQYLVEVSENVKVLDKAFDKPHIQF